MTPDKRVEEEYTSHIALKEWEAEKDQNTLTQNIVALLGIHGMHCKFYEYQDASHITKAFESLFTQDHQDLMSEVVEKQTIRNKAESATGEMLRSLKEDKLEKEEALEWFGYIRGLRDMVYDLNCQKNGESKTHDDLKEAQTIIKSK